MIDIMKLSEAELRQLAEDGLEIIEPLVRVVATGTNGTYPCPQCSFTASWARTGKDWRADCDCGWNAAGFLGPQAPSN